MLGESLACWSSTGCSDEVLAEDCGEIAELLVRHIVTQAGIHRPAVCVAKQAPKGRVGGSGTRPGPTEMFLD